MWGFVWDWAYRSHPAKPEQPQLDFSREPMVGAGAVRPAAPRQMGRYHSGQARPRLRGQARPRRPRANLSPILGEDENKIERVQRGEILCIYRRLQPSRRQFSFLQAQTSLLPIRAEGTMG